MAVLNQSFFVDAATSVPEKFDFYAQAQFDRYSAFIASGGVTIPWGNLKGNIIDQADLALQLFGGGAFILDEGNATGVGFNIVFDDNGATG